MKPFIDRAALKQGWRRALVRAASRTAVLAVVALLLTAGLAWAGDPTGAETGTAVDITAVSAGSPTVSEVAQDLGHLKVGTNMFFIIIGVALIFFMQAGVMLVETGFCRSKNAAHVAMRLARSTVGPSPPSAA